MELNILFIGRHSFPNGYATTKRHKYLIDYLLSRNIRVSKYSTWQNDGISNPAEGYYQGKAFYKNTQHSKSILSIFKIVRETCSFIRTNYSKNSKNIIIFSTILHVEEIIPWLYASVKGYKIFFDVVENYDSHGGDATPFTKLYFYITKTAYKKAAGIFVISSLLEKHFKAYKNFKTCLLPNSAEIRCENHKQSFSSPFTVTYTGTFASKDGVRYLVEGFHIFSQMPHVNAELLLIGNGKTDSATDSLLDRNSHIKRLGFVSDDELAGLIHSSDVLAMTRCNSEFANYGFPFKLSEYLATGNTVIATDVGDVAAYLTDKHTAYIVPPENSKAIADALYHIYTHEKEAIQIGKNGQQVVRLHFDKQINGSKFVDFIRQQTLSIPSCNLPSN